MAHQSARTLAFQALSTWRPGQRFADAILEQLLRSSALGGADRAFATELFYGVLRNLSLLDFWIGLLRRGSIDHRSRDLLRLGLYQLLCLRTPSHAAVFETVELSTPRQRPFINAVLRAALRRLAELETAARAEPLATRFSHPAFLVKKWSATYGLQAATQLCEWNNQPPPIYARINRLRTTVETFLAEYPPAVQLSGNTKFVHLQSLPSEALARGDCYIQDPSTSLACELLDPQPGERVLDACAAPGGKSGLLAELMDNRGQLIACDRDSSRLETLRQNLGRLGVTSARVVLQNWTTNEVSPEFLPGSFDRILVDAPCTNTGVMRRRVDVRWRLRLVDGLRMQTEQLAILRRVVPLLRPSGVLVYSTCSIEAEENESVVKRVLEHFPSLLLHTQESILPFRNRFDGAFAAKLTHIGKLFSI